MNQTLKNKDVLLPFATDPKILKSTAFKNKKINRF